MSTSSPIAYSETHIAIRGRHLRIDELIDERQLEKDNALRLHDSLRRAEPFEHLVIKGLFNDRLLELIHEEFDEMNNRARMSGLDNRYESTRRSTPGSRLGPAAQLYFWLVNSAPFVEFLGLVSGTQNLIPDAMLIGGGMHETHNGGHFAIHRDFENHFKNGLSNAMVFITYLNRDWLPSYGGALELWDNQRKQCAAKIPPDFGVSLLMRHGPKSYHGYSTPLTLPPGRSRRSIAAYYYTNNQALRQGPSRTSRLLFAGKADMAREKVKQFIPPIVWNGLKKLTRSP